MKSICLSVLGFRHPAYPTKRPNVDAGRARHKSLPKSVLRRKCAGSLLHNFKVLAKESASGTGSPNPSRFVLEELDLVPVLNIEGCIACKIPEGTEATVFIIYNDEKKPQYIGFSKEFESSLRTVFCRQPDKTHFYRAAHLQSLDKDLMMSIRSSWFEQLSGPPSGNKVPNERAAWQGPVQALALSDRGKRAAAEELVKQHLVKIRRRGCREPLIPNRELLDDGLVDFLLDFSAESQHSASFGVKSPVRECSVVIAEEVLPFTIAFDEKLKTNGGHLFDLSLTFEDCTSQHRVIVGEEFSQQQGLDPELVIERVFAFILAKRIPRHTEGDNAFPSVFSMSSNYYLVVTGYLSYLDKYVKQTRLINFTKSSFLHCRHASKW